MADKRMFSKTVIGSGRFLKMPQSSRLLYYDLGMYADDDGIVEAFTIMRQTGANEDDLRVLASKGFVQVLNEELVTAILDWKTNNAIRPDRYRPSEYHNLLVRLTDGQVTDICPTTDNQVTPQVRLGKDRLGEDRIDIDKRKRFTPPTLEEVQAYCRERNNRVDPQRFVDFYASKGWLVGKTPMKDWQAAVRNWERGEKDKIKEKQGKKSFDQRDYEAEGYDNWDAGSIMNRPRAGGGT